MMGSGSAIPGEETFTTSGTFTVPLGVTSVSVICVGDGSGANLHSTFDTNVVVGYGSNLMTGGSYIGDGGGNGGNGSYQYDPGNWRYGTGGGAGGYSGNGGNGVNINDSYSTTYGLDGQGGGGAGAGSSGTYQARSGGGVGLHGEGPSGFGVKGMPGTGGSQGKEGRSANSVHVDGGSYGGGHQGYHGRGGGGLGWKNNIIVSPGEAIPITTGGNGAVRIIWGIGRAFPSTNTKPIDYEFYIESGPYVDGTGTATFTAPATWTSGVNVAYLGHAMDYNSGSSTYSNDITWDGVSSDYFVGSEDNTDEESISGGLGLKNVTFSDWTKVAYHSRTNPNGVSGDIMSGVKIIGGNTPLAMVYSSAVGNVAVKTYTTAVQKGDLVFMGATYRQTHQNYVIEATNMEEQYNRQVFGSTTRFALFFHVVEADGTFTTTVSSGGPKQQYISALAVLRFT